MILAKTLICFICHYNGFKTIFHKSLYLKENRNKKPKGNNKTANDIGMEQQIVTGQGPYRS